VELRDLGARVHLYAEDGDYLGVTHAPRPVEPGDTLALDGCLWRITAVVALTTAGAVDALCEVEPVST
jgi:hypothetical protein